MNQSCIIHDKAIKVAVKRLGEQINKSYADQDPILLCILNGAFIFFADLVRYIDISHQVDFAQITSYGDGITPGDVAWVLKPSIDIAGRNVLIVDDIIDTGQTARFVCSNLRMRKAKSVAVCALLSKMANRKWSIYAPYVGFEIADTFVYGYGLDRKGRDRNLRAIYGNGE